jgi:hypothetical protein
MTTSQKQGYDKCPRAHPDKTLVPDLWTILEFCEDRDLVQQLRRLLQQERCGVQGRNRVSKHNQAPGNTRLPPCLAIVFWMHMEPECQISCLPASPRLMTSALLSIASFGGAAAIAALRVDSNNSSV